MPRFTSRKWRLLALIAAVSLIFAACGNDDDDDAGGGGGGGEKKTVAIAMVGPLTGPNAALGINIRDGIKVALDEANKASSKYTYKMKEFDTQGDPAQAPGQAARYVPDQEIIALVGPTFSGETRAVLPTLQEQKLVMVSASATNVQLPTVVPNETVFHRVIPDDDVQGKGLVQYITKVLKPKKAAYIHDNTDYGKGLFEGVVKDIGTSGIQTTLTDAIDPKSSDYSAAVNKVVAAKPDVLFYGGYYNEAGLFKKQLTDAGVTATFISGDGSLDLGFVRRSGTAGGEGAILTCPCQLATAEAGGKMGAFATKYKTMIGKDPGTYTADGYDATQILV
jgi:branched-chain amino acid transport system substrate-binding protein